MDILGFPAAAALVQNPPIPISPSSDWGKRPGFEGAWPLIRWSDSRFERDPQGFFFDKFNRIGVSHWAKEVRIRVHGTGDQDLVLVFLQKIRWKDESKRGEPMKKLSNTWEIKKLPLEPHSGSPLED